MPLKTRSAPLSGWGRYPVANCVLVEPDDPTDFTHGIQGADSFAIARGNGRSYGDSSLSPECTVGMRRLDRLLSFDHDTGMLTCEAGVLLSDVIDVFLPRGWFPPVTPGTKFVTIGGMIASDVHGKNHHVAGSFCEHVSSVDIALGDGRVLTCSAEQNSDLFAATCGGMGLTGIILHATFRLIRVTTSRIDQRIIRVANLRGAMDVFEASVTSTYSVAWLDCLASGAALGRGVVVLGEHATIEQLPERDRTRPVGRPKRKVKRFPVDLPAFMMNRFSVATFNRIYYRSQRPGNDLVDLDPYFYPLDAVHDWNRMYGRNGFVQYQCAVPLKSCPAALSELLTEIAQRGTPSFLAVLKRLGPESFGYLSFPMEGYTLALDFPVNAQTFHLLDRLDDVVMAHGGRLYLAKDARASRRVIENGYPRLEKFRDVRRRYGLQARFRSLQAQRLEL